MPIMLMVRAQYCVVDEDDSDGDNIWDGGVVTNSGSDPDFGDDKT